MREIPLSRIPVFLTTTVFCRGDFRGRRPNLRRLANEGPQGPVGRKEVQSGPRRQRKGMARPLIPGVIPSRHINTRALFRTKRPHQTIPGEAANRASTSQAPRPDSEAGTNTRRPPGAPPIEDADKLSATHSEVESSMNHRRRRTVLRDACFSQEALDAFNSGDAYLRAAQNGLARATEQYVKDIRVSNFNSYICQ